MNVGSKDYMLYLKCDNKRVTLSLENILLLECGNTGHILGNIYKFKINILINLINVLDLFMIYFFIENIFHYKLYLI